MQTPKSSPPHPKQTKPMASTNTNTPEPPRKRQKKMDNISLQELPADEFMNKIKLFSGQEVIVCVGGKEFEVPKALLCYCSPYFERALNGEFKEGVEQMVTLEGHSSEAFQLVVQWIYQSKIVLPQGSGETSVRSSPLSVAPSESDNKAVRPSVEVEKSEKTIQTQQQIEARLYPRSVEISRYLDFVVLADYIELVGAFEPVETAITTIVANSRPSLRHEHVRAAMAFPAKHPIRQLFIKATVREYIEHLIHGKKFRFAKEVEESDGFAADLLRESTKAFAQKLPGTKSADKSKFYVVDPLGGKILVTTIPRNSTTG